MKTKIFNLLSAINSLGSSSTTKYWKIISNDEFLTSSSFSVEEGYLYLLSTYCVARITADLLMSRVMGISNPILQTRKLSLRVMQLIGGQRGI